MAAKVFELTKQRNELAEKRNAIVDKANAALRAAQDKAKAAGGKLAKEDLAADDAFEAEIKALDSQVADLDGDLEIEARAWARQKGVIKDAPEQERAAREHMRLTGEPSVPGAGPIADRTSKTAWPSLGAQVLAVKRAAMGPTFTDPRLIPTANAGLMAASGASESVDSDGGFLVEREYAGFLTAKTFDTGVLVGKCTKQPVGAGFNGIKFSLIDELSRATGSRFGGLQVYWAAEAAAFTATKPKMRRLEMNLEKLIGLMYMTDELMADQTALEGYINQWFPKEFGFMLDNAIVNGTGGGMPLGILNSPALVSIAAEGGQLTKTIVASNLEKMFAAVPATALMGAEWYFNVACWPQLFQLSHAIGTAGVPVFLPPNGISGGPFGTLLGRPVTPIEQASALGTKGDIFLAALDQYIIADKGPIETAASIHVKFLTDEMAFRWVLRINGQPIPAAPLTPFAGTQTLSPFVALATR